MPYRIYLEKSKSDRARCMLCDGEIKKNEIRGVHSRHCVNHLEFRYICFKCVPQIIQENIKKDKDILKEYNKWIRKNKGIMILREL